MKLAHGFFQPRARRIEPCAVDVIRRRELDHGSLSRRRGDGGFGHPGPRNQFGKGYAISRFAGQCRDAARRVGRG